VPNGPRRARRIWWLGTFDRLFHTVTGLVAAGILLLIAAITLVLVTQASPSIVRFGPGFLLSSAWDSVRGNFGALPAIVGTLVTSALALVIAVPIALGAAMFMSDLGPRRLREPLTYVIDLSAAVPSVVFGFWAFIVVVPWMRSTAEPDLAWLTGGRFPFSGPPLGLDILTASIVLAIMIIPTVAALSREALRAVPASQRDSALSLGMTRWDALRIAGLRPAAPGIAAAIVLGLGRALGETIAVLMVIGNIYQVPTSLLSPGTTLASWIANDFTAVGPGLEMNALLELGVILLVVTVVVNVIARLVLRRIEKLPGNGDEAPQGPRAASSTSVAPRSNVAPIPPRLQALAALPPLPHHAAEWRTRRLDRRRWVYYAAIALVSLAVVLAIVPLVDVTYIAAERGGAAVIQPSFYTSVPPLGCNPGHGVNCSLGGIGPEIQGTLIMLGLGAAIALPVGILAGIYIADYGRGRFARAVDFVVDVMTGIPTILLGVFVFVVFLRLDHDAASSALSGSVGLAILMIPIVVRGTVEALRTVPREVREAAAALGFPRHRTNLRVALSCARGELVTGALLAAARAAGDTAILLVTAGGSILWFQGLNSETAAITPFIFNNFQSEYTNLQTDAWGAALVLLIIMLAINLGARLATRSHVVIAEPG
jgi:phosphate transport system permease protein